jgi:hypothetical protein
MKKVNLLSILLYLDIGWISIIILKSITKSYWIIILLQTDLQMCEHQLHLMQQIIVDRPVFGEFDGVGRLVVVRQQDRTAEGRDAEELLQHRVHVADATVVTQTHEVLS